VIEKDFEGTNRVSFSRLDLYLFCYIWIFSIVVFLDIDRGSNPPKDECQEFGIVNVVSKS
jgi:hypothetical protein